MEGLAVQVENVVAVGLDEVRFVDALFLVVGAGEVFPRRPGLWRRSVGGLGRCHFAVHGDVVFHPSPAVEVLVFNRLEKLNTHFLLKGLLEGVLEICARGVAGQMRATNRPLRQLVPSIGQFDDIQIGIDPVFNGAQTS